MTLQEATIIEGFLTELSTRSVEVRNALPRNELSDAAWNRLDKMERLLESFQVWARDRRPINGEEIP